MIDIWSIMTYDVIKQTGQVKRWLLGKAEGT